MLAQLLVVAAITDKLADFATRVVGDLGLPGIFLLMVPESACIPIPSEATMLLIGSWIAYAVGYYGRIETLERHKIFHVKPEHLALTERWFERYGSWAVFFSRMLPIVRTFISLPAGVARMPFWRFTVLTLAGCVPWILMLTLIGKAARDNWDQWKDRLHYVDYAMAALILLAIIYIGQRWWRARRARPAADAA
jgi:membrane protein DedA with SNARE-associated domain